MKQSKHILPMLAVMAISASASANEIYKGNGDGGSGVAKSAEIHKERRALEETIQLLNESGGIAVDKDGKIHIDKNVVQNLKDQGRWSVKMASNDSVCN